MYFEVVDLENIFDRVPRDVVWWAFGELGLEQWLIKIYIQSIYRNACSRVRTDGNFSDDFLV